jgi:hypothetical protein
VLSQFTSYLLSATSVAGELLISTVSGFTINYAEDFVISTFLGSAQKLSLENRLHLSHKRTLLREYVNLNAFLLSPIPLHQKRCDKRKTVKSSKTQTENAFSQSCVRGSLTRERERVGLTMSKIYGKICMVFLFLLTMCC